MIKNIRQINPFGLRIPEELKNKLEEFADNNARSLNSEMVKRLEDSFKSPLHFYSDAELVAELISRYPRGAIHIRIGNPDDSAS